MEQTFRVLYTTNACGDHFFYGIFCPVSPSFAIINKTCSASIFRFHWLTLQSSGRALWKLPWGLSCAPGTNTPMELSLEALQDTQLLKLLWDRDNRVRFLYRRDRFGSGPGPSVPSANSVS